MRRPHLERASSDVSVATVASRRRHFNVNVRRCILQLNGVAEASLRVIEGRSILAPERASERGFAIGSLTFLSAALASAAGDSRL